MKVFTFTEKFAGRWQKACIQNIKYISLSYSVTIHKKAVFVTESKKSNDKEELIDEIKKSNFSFQFSFQIDPTMMAALMAASSLILAGSNTEEVSFCVRVRAYVWVCEWERERSVLFKQTNKKDRTR